MLCVRARIVLREARPQWSGTCHKLGASQRSLVEWLEVVGGHLREEVDLLCMDVCIDMRIHMGSEIVSTCLLTHV